MKALFSFLLFFSWNSLSAQCIADVYPIYESDPYLFLSESPNIVVLNPIPFETTYLVELDSETFVHRVQLDKNIESISLSLYQSGAWKTYYMDDNQTFTLNATVRYILVRYKDGCECVHLLID